MLFDVVEGSLGYADDVRVFIVDKPLGLTSHDVVGRARRLLGTRRVGHAGTLDPLAVGVLVLLVDEGTKLAPFLSGSDKTYLAWVALGVGTPTLDAEGPIEASADADHLDAAAVEAALPAFLRLREQRPPAYSAVQRGGERAYAAARRGERVELPPRPARYHRLELLAFLPSEASAASIIARDERGWRLATAGEAAASAEAAGSGSAGATAGEAATAAAATAAPPTRRLSLPQPLAPSPLALIRLRVAAGTYVRAFARDLGAALGVPAHLRALVRTAAGSADLAQAVPLEALQDAAPIDPLTLLPYPQVTLDDMTARAVRDGKRPPAAFQGRAALVDPDGALVAIADAVEGRVRSQRVWRS